MKEHPILFSTPMVQAILEGRKTQTRRVVKMKKQITDPAFGYTAFTPKNHISVRGIHANGQYGESFFKCPYGQPGDLLYVRETFTPYRTDKYLYKADEILLINGAWKPSIHMPKAAARIWLEVEEVKVEWLQDISEEDAKEEGVTPDLATDHPKGVYYTAFSDLWTKINGNGSWISNPWVWVIKFKVLSTTGATSIQNPATSNQQPVC